MMCRLRKKCVRYISVFLAVILAVVSCSIGFFTYAKNKTVDISKNILDSILEDRYWIIETLAEGNIENNPYAAVNTSATGETIMKEVLTNYQNDKAFKTLVDAMDTYANTGQKLVDVADDVLSVFDEWFGEGNTVDDLVASTDELKYESILNDVLQTDYTSSWGDTLFAQNMDLENLKQKANVFNKLSSYQKNLADYLNMSLSDSSAIVFYNPNDIQYASYQITLQDYVDHLLSAYGTDLESYLNTVIDIPGLEGNEALEKKIISVGALGMISLYEQAVMPETSANIDDIFYDGMFDDTMKILNGAGKALNIVNKSMDYAILLEALQSQKNTTVSAMNRVASNTSDDDLAKVLNNYADLVNSQGDTMTLGYETITNYLRNNSAVTNIVKDMIVKQAPKLIEAAVKKFGGAQGLVLQNGIASALSKAGAIISIAVWVADQTTGIQDTAKKIYLCKYIDRIINEVALTLQDDLITYTLNPTEENAQKVLADLEFLKELRLYGEKCAYGSMCAQMDSWVGLLLGGGDTRDYLDKRYQASIDTYLGCSLFSQTYNQISLSKGDVLSIIMEDVDGKDYCTATWKKAGGGQVSFAEADLRLLGGLDLNGATLNIFSADQGLYLPLVKNDTDGGKINIYCDNVAFGEISNTASLDIEFFKNVHELEITDAIANSGTLRITSANTQTKLTVYDVTNSKSLSLSGVDLYAKGAVNNSGAVEGNVYLCGDGTLGYENAYFGVKQQTVTGDGTFSDVCFENALSEGVLLSGNMTVTDTVSNTSTRVKNTTNLILTNSCHVVNDTLHAGATLKDYTSAQPLTFNDVVCVSGNVALSSPCIFNDTLSLASNCTELSQNGVTVKGDLMIEGGVLTGESNIDLRGNLAVNTESAVISSLRLCGLQSQTVNGDSFTVGTLINNNHSVGGVTFNTTVNVTQHLDNNAFPVSKNGQNIVLTGNAVAANNRVNTSVSAKDWTCTEDLTVNGNLYTSGQITVSSGTDLSVQDYSQASGSLALESGSTLNCKKSFYNCGTTENAGTLNVKEDSVLKGALNGGTFNTNGDVKASAAFAPDILYFNNSSPQAFTNSAETAVKTLQIDNNSKSGFTVGSVINVSEQFTNNCKHLINPQNIVLVDDGGYDNPAENAGDVQTSGAMTVKQGETLVIDGDLNLRSGALLTVPNGGNLIVKGHLTGTSAGITVENGGSVTVTDYLNLSSTALNVSGDITVKNDAVLSSCTVDSFGTLCLFGDLNAKSCTWKNANLSFVGQTPQVISGNDITANRLLVENRSKSGVTFETKVNYQSLDTGSSVINGSNNLIEIS